MSYSSSTLADVVLAARVLVLCAPEDRAHRCNLMFEQAARAASFVNVAGAVHPFLGDGSLSSLALRHRCANMASTLAPCFVDSLQLVLSKIADHEMRDTSNR